MSLKVLCTVIQNSAHRMLMEILAPFILPHTSIIDSAGEVKPTIKNFVIFCELSNFLRYPAFHIRDRCARVLYMYMGIS